MMSTMIKKTIRESIVNSSVYDVWYMRKIKKVIASGMDVPDIVRIEPTNICNAHCAMCPREKLIRPHGIMSQELFEKIARECRQLSIAKMLFSGFGEPLIDKNIVSKIKLARENGIKEITLFTNASLLDERIASDLVRSGVSAVIIRLDATTTEDFAKA